MDTGKGNFREITGGEFLEEMLEEKPMVFQVGEILEIRGSRFRVDKILNKKMVLKLLKQLNTD